jgi:excisionase family DNA binding protein
MATAAAESLASLVADGFVRVPEAVRFMALSRATLYALMESGDLPFCKIGRARLIPRKALAELAERSLVSGSKAK